MATNKWVDKQNVEYKYTMNYYSAKKRNVISYIHYSMDEIPKQ